MPITSSRLTRLLLLSGSGGDGDGGDSAGWGGEVEIGTCDEDTITNIEAKEIQMKIKIHVTRWRYEGICDEDTMMKANSNTNIMT